MARTFKAAVEAQTNPARSTRQETLLQETDLINAADDNIPPPAYGDIYGEIRDEKGGLGARVTDDGRVNISINQFNRRLSQIPPSLGGKEEVTPPPPLNVVIQVVGSRRDVQPFVALGKVVKDTYGHRVRLATHSIFKGFVQENGLEFFSIGGDPSQLMAFMVKNPGLMPGFRSLLSGDVGQRRRDVAGYAMIEVLMWQGLGDIINRFRVKCLGLDPVSLIWAPGMLQRLKVPHTYCWSPDLIAKPKDWGPHISISGFYFLSLASNYTPAPDLQAFLDAGITAGRPTLVVPFFGDQPFWGAMVARAGAGPDPIPYKQLTADKLADAINFCLKSESLEVAKELASKIAAERGTAIGAQSFHQYLDVDRLRCTLAPSRPATWRIKRTQVRLSAFAACTLANAKLVDFHDLKLFRPQEYYTDKGPWDPISGFSAAVFGAISSMALGVADIPSETLEALLIPFGSSREHSKASVLTMAMESETSLVGKILTPATSPEQSQTSLNVQESLARVRSPSNLSGLSTPTSNIGSSSMSDALTGKLSPKQDDASRSRVRSWNESSSGKDRDMLRQTGVHTSKGFGRIAKAVVQPPMDLLMSITEGFHNAPKLWGDDTVRPQQQVSDFKSGAKAPWKGAQKEGTSGFLKGIGKGIGGFLTKPGAALFGIPGYIMKGVHKEVQKLSGNNVQNYIIASRVAQGYEEWLQSSDAEKQDVIVCWKLIQKYLKKKRNPDEMVQDILEAQRKMNLKDREAPQNSGRTASSARSANSADALTQGPESVMLSLGGSESPLCPANMAPEETLGAARINETIRLAGEGSFGAGNHTRKWAKNTKVSPSPVRFPTRLSIQETSRGDAEEDVNVERAIQEDVSQLQRQQQEATGHQADQENLRQAMATSEAEAQRHAREALEHEEQLNQVIAQSLRKKRPRGSHSEWESDMSLEVEDNDELERARNKTEQMAEKAAAVAGSSTGVQPYPSYDQGISRAPRKKTEEEIVIEYVKKKSLLEQGYQNKGKGRTTATEDKDDEDLQKALKFSMQRHEHNAEYRYGGASSSERLSGADERNISCRT
ncbi:hypothetical protein V502_01367 [Pseudogymnoascus sp. VKM F-4520 (FW-2644)]|nr:hypothetical protein V502_01367 [Pseudogymnoascus sp. VKM F-4520 (FW-2644)]